MTTFYIPKDKTTSVVQTKVSGTNESTGSTLCKRAEDGSLNLTGLNLDEGGAGSFTTLQSYFEQDMVASFTFQGGGTISSVDIIATRVGRIVTLYVSSGYPYTNAVAGNGYFTMNAQLPAIFRPNLPKIPWGFAMVNDSGTISSGTWYTDHAGILHVGKVGGWNATDSNCGWYGFTATYTV